MEITAERGSLNSVEKEWILKVLEKTDWKYSEAAKRLGISRTTLWRKVRSYDLGEEKSPVH